MSSTKSFCEVSASELEINEICGGWGYRFDYQAPTTIIIIDDPRDWGVR